MTDTLVTPTAAAQRPVYATNPTNVEGGPLVIRHGLADADGAHIGISGAPLHVALDEDSEAVIARDTSVQALGSQLASILQQLGVIVQGPNYTPTTTTQTLSASGPGALVPISLADLIKLPANFAPSILCSVSAGAALTYSIEVTGDDITAQGYNSSSGNWFGFDGMVGLSSSQNGTLGGRVTAVRPRVLNRNSGTLTVSIIV